MRSITIIIPAKNEEKTLAKVVLGTLNILGSCSDLNRVIIVNDGSVDKTLRVAEDLQNKFSGYVRIVSHKNSVGLGGAFKSALPFVETDFVAWLPADGEIDCDSLKEVLKYLPHYDVLVAYPAISIGRRPFYRIFLSWIFQRSMNILFINNVKYFNGNSAYLTSHVRGIDLKSNGFFFNAELLMKCMKKFKPSYRQIPFYLNPRSFGSSKALKLKNVFQVIRDCLWLRIELFYYG